MCIFRSNGLQAKAKPAPRKPSARAVVDSDDSETDGEDSDAQVRRVSHAFFPNIFWKQGSVLKKAARDKLNDGVLPLLNSQSSALASHALRLAGICGVWLLFLLP